MDPAVCKDRSLNVCKELERARNLEDLPVEIISDICSFLPTFNILAMERISSTLHEKVMSSNIYMKRLLYLQKNRKITHCSIMLKDISQFSDKMELPLFYRAILLTRVMLARCHAQYYHLIWSREVKEGVREDLAKEGLLEDCFGQNGRYCSRTQAAKNFYSKSYEFAVCCPQYPLRQCCRIGYYAVKLGDIINKDNPDTCFKKLMEIIDSKFKPTVHSCIRDILVDNVLLD